jgi:hypothetical protein
MSDSLRFTASILALLAAAACAPRSPQRVGAGALPLTAGAGSTTGCTGNPSICTAGNIAAGGLHTVVVTAAGQVWDWGFNNNGELGDGTGADKSTPQLPALLCGPISRRIARS